MSEYRVITKEEWTAEAVKLFGEDPFGWKFVCPGCGNVASVEEFRAFKDRGATPNAAYQECIGRYTGGRSWANERSGRPCDYAAYGLLCICKTLVLIEGKEIPVFEFARGEG